LRRPGLSMRIILKMVINILKFNAALMASDLRRLQYPPKCYQHLKVTRQHGKFERQVHPCARHKGVWGVEIELHTFLTSVVEVSVQFYVPSALQWGNHPSIPIKYEDG